MACWNCCASNEGEEVAAVINPVTESLYAPPDPTAPGSQLSQKKPGKPCTSRFPTVGDVVMCMGGKKLGHDAAGTPKMWVLNPGQDAEVVEVDADGDFRLRNSSGIESGFLFRAEFVYIAGAEGEEPVLVPEQKKRPSNADKNSNGGGDIKAQAEVKPMPIGPPAAGWFEVALQKQQDTDKCGLHLDMLHEKAYQVIMVADGLVKAYNDTASDDKKILPGFFLMGINGQAGKRMLDELQSQKQLTLTISPSAKFTVQIERPATGPLGLNLSYEDKCNSLLFIGCTTGSPVDVYNKTAPDEKKMVEGDRIVEINGVKGPSQMLETLKSATAITLQVERPLC
jgi:hypothetical protein